MVQADFSDRDNNPMFGKCQRTDSLIELEDSSKNPVLNREPLLTNDFLRAGKEWGDLIGRLPFPQECYMFAFYSPFGVRYKHK